MMINTYTNFNFYKFTYILIFNIMSEQKKELLNTLKNNYRAKRDYGMFIPGYILGAFLATRVKIHLSEPTFASLLVII